VEQLLDPVFELVGLVEPEIPDPRCISGCALIVVSMQASMTVSSIRLSSSAKNRSER
jgi:hypothetical protein